ncbi:MmcQ/YjbR family DNA-binding protein [Aquamicrobium ahrensii]|uniref:MmcQ/YjbR family DNA-binding protein n=1 Tax=Aquamicrobium ahrensii TaxID=469551 RepID=A0ABV2KP77_9HYPH
MTFEEAMDYALTLPGTEPSTSYRQPCVKVNGNGFLFVGHEPQESFALHMEMTTKQIVLETHPETFFETPHYSGYPIVLVRYDGLDGDLIREMIRRAADWARAKAPPRPRKKR